MRSRPTAACAARSQLSVGVVLDDFSSQAETRFHMQNPSGEKENDEQQPDRRRPSTTTCNISIARTSLESDYPKQESTQGATDVQEPPYSSEHPSEDAEFYIMI